MRWMRTFTLLSISAFVVNLTPVGAMAGTIHTSVVYGEDNRQDLWEVKDPELIRLARSTVALIDQSRFTYETDRVRVRGENFGGRYGLCRDERFVEQDTAAYCSGFLVGPQTVVTAGHCMDDATDCKRARFVFDFAKTTSESAAPLEFSHDNVYSCSEIVKRQAKIKGADFAVVKLDRPVIAREPLRLNRGARPRIGDELVLIGNPAGLPTKVATDGRVRMVSTQGYLVATTDSYSGNSGAAVLNARTFEVEGILVRGEQDFYPAGRCNRSTRCFEAGCRGEDVTLIDEVLPFLEAPNL